ncbi:peptidase S1 and S6 chymotrypsin HAP, partial [Trifolium pratense]
MRTKVLLSIAEWGKFYEKMRGSIVCIHEKIGEEITHPIGGGVFLLVGSRKLVLTAAHVVKGEKKLSIVTYNKVLHDVKLLHIDFERDVALLDVLGKSDEFECTQLCETNELTISSEIHFIGHPRRQIFAYNIGNVCCAEKNCRNIYEVWDIHHPQLKSYDLIDDFRELPPSMKLVQAKNVHGGGRFGGSGAPFLDGDGNIIGLYSFSFKEEDNAIHVAKIKASIESFNQARRA